MKRLSGLLCLSLLMVVVPVLAAESNAVGRSVVEVLITAQRYDANVPWRRERPTLRSGYGVVISPTRIVTTEDLVRNAVLIEIRRPGGSDKIAAALVQSDARANAALLDISAAPAGQPFIPADWDGKVATGTKVNLVQFDAAGQMQTGEGRITEIAVGPLPNAPYNLLTYSVLTDLKLDRTGAPAFHEGRLVGLVMQYDAASQTSLILPTAVLKRFVENVANPPYQGLATAGVFYSSLIDPAKRRFYGLQENNTGVLVLRTVPGSGASVVLMPDDIILEWDGQAVDSQGYYNDAEFGRLSFSHLIAGHRLPGDTIPVVIWRNKQRITLKLRLDPFADAWALIPLNTEGEQTAYLVEGGVILRELTADYLLSRGNRWMLASNPRLVHLYLTRAQFPEKPGQRVVVLSAVLPDAINRGFENYRDDVVTHVNGKPVSNLKDVFAIRERDNGIWRIATQGRGVDIVLDREQLAEANQRIAEQYRIPRLRSLR
jgi:S1-C subfamily serine protease